MTGFHQYATVGLTQRSQNLCNVHGNECCVQFCREWGLSTLCAAELTRLSSFQKPQKLATGPNFASEICSGPRFFSICGKWSKFFRGNPYFAIKKVLGALLIKKWYSSGGNQFGASILELMWTTTTWYTQVSVQASCSVKSSWICVWWLWPHPLLPQFIYPGCYRLYFFFGRRGIVVLQMSLENMIITRTK